MPPSVELVERALVELRTLHSRDPAAARALAAVRLAAHTLESFWLPALADRDEVRSEHGGRR